jgi:hypothetical protein
MGPDLVVGTRAHPAQSVDGLTGAADGSRVLAFAPDGSLRHAGALRFGQGKSRPANIFEVRIEPAANPRVELRKWTYDATEGGRDGGFVPAGSAAWKWY